MVNSLFLMQLVILELGTLYDDCCDSVGYCYLAMFHQCMYCLGKLHL
jgi:hypothetical protein